jgi:F420 biosynthesis protein FbiB-like protein
MRQAEVYHEFLRSRRSVRHFLPDPVAEDVVKRILETAVHAPSAHNRQPWRFIFVQSPDAKIRLADQMGADFRVDLIADGLSAQQADAQVERSRCRILEAPLVIVLCCDKAALDNYPDERRQKAETTMAVQSVALAGGTLLLAAHAEGLGGVWVCAPLFAPESVRRALDIPQGWEPQGMLLLGYPAKVPDFRTRMPAGEVSRFV